MDVPVAGPSDASDPGREGDASAPAWGIGAVSERYDVAANTLRSWDRRYGVGPSQRSEGGHRRYSVTDMQRVGVMVRMTGRGVPAATAARVTLALSEEDLSSALQQPAQPLVAAPVTETDVDAILVAAGALDAPALRGLFRGALDRTDVASAWTSTIAPALQKIGVHWSTGALGVHAEHLASEVLVSELRGHTQRARFRREGPPQSPTVVLASADDEQHYIPLLALEAHLADHGVESLLLGPRVPAESLLGLLGQTESPVVFMWASIDRPAEDPLFDVLARSTRRIDVVVGGPGWPTDLEPTRGSVRLVQVATFAQACSAIERRLPLA